MSQRTLNLTAGEQDGGGGYYAPCGDNNEVDETQIIYIPDEHPIPKGYEQVPDAESRFLGPWIFNFLGGKIYPTVFDNNSIQAIVDSSYDTPDKKPYELLIRIQHGNGISTIYVEDGALEYPVRFCNTGPTSTCDWSTLNSIVSEMKGLPPGKFRFKSKGENYKIRKI